MSNLEISLLENISCKWIDKPFRKGSANNYGVDCFSLVYLILCEYFTFIKHDENLNTLKDIFNQFFLEKLTFEKIIKIASAVEKIDILEINNSTNNIQINPLDILLINTLRDDYHFLLCVDNNKFIHASDISNKVNFVSNFNILKSKKKFIFRFQTVY